MVVGAGTNLTVSLDQVYLSSPLFPKLSTRCRRLWLVAGTGSQTFPADLLPAAPIAEGACCPPARAEAKVLRPALARAGSGPRGAVVRGILPLVLRVSTPETLVAG